MNFAIPRTLWFFQPFLRVYWTHPSFVAWCIRKRHRSLKHACVVLSPCCWKQGLSSYLFCASDFDMFLPHLFPKHCTHMHKLMIFCSAVWWPWTVGFLSCWNRAILEVYSQKQNWKGYLHIHTRKTHTVAHAHTRTNGMHSPMKSKQYHNPSSVFMMQLREVCRLACFTEIMRCLHMYHVCFQNRCLRASDLRSSQRLTHTPPCPCS